MLCSLRLTFRSCLNLKNNSFKTENLGKELRILEKMGRGGPRHSAKPYVDPGVLLKCLEKHTELLAEMGAYDVLGSNAALDFKALLRLKPLWTSLLKAESSGQIAPKPLRQALGALLAERPHLNSTVAGTGSMWVSLKLERLNVLLTHLRRCGREERCMVLAASKLTKPDYRSLREGLERLDVSTQPTPEAEHALPLENGEVEAPQSPKKRLWAKTDGSPKKRRSLEFGKSPEDLGKGLGGRALKQEDSNVTLDSTGLPQVFGQNATSPAASGARGSQEAGRSEPEVLEKHQSQGLEKLHSLKRPGSRLREASG